MEQSLQGGSSAALSKITRAVTLEPSNPICRNLPKGTLAKKKKKKKDLGTGHFVANPETIQLFTNTGGLAEHGAVKRPRGAGCHHKKEEEPSPTTTWMHVENITPGKRGQHKGQKVYDSIQTKCPEWINPKRQNIDPHLPEAWGRGEAGEEGVETAC